MKKLITTLLVLVMVVTTLAFTGCGYTEIDAEALGNKVLAEVNGEQILRKEWSEQYDYLAALYQQYGYDLTTHASFFESLKTDVLTSLIQQKLWEQKAKAAKFFEYSEEDRATATKEVEDQIEETIKSSADEYYESLHEQEGKDYDHYYNAAKEKYEKNMALQGITKEDLINDQLKANAMDKYKEDYLKDEVVLDADLYEAYNDLRKQQTEEFLGDDEKDYAAFVDAWNSGENMVVILDGYVLVQHILIKFDKKAGETVAQKATALSSAKTAFDKLEAEVTKLREEKTKLEEELAKLTEDAAKEAKQKEIDAKQKAIDEKLNADAYKTAKEAYDKAKKEHQEARDTAVANTEIKNKATEVLNAVKGGDEAKFIEQLIANTEDTGMTDEETAKKGYLVGTEDKLMEEFHDGALALKNDGDISELVVTDYGYHIIRRMKALEERTGDNVVPLSELSDKMREELLEQQKSEKWEKDLTTWYDDGVKNNTVKIHKEWLKDFN